MKIGGWGNVIINPLNYIHPPREILGILYFRENNCTINYEIKNLEKETKEIREKVGKIDKVKRNGKKFPWKRVLRLEGR